MESSPTRGRVGPVNTGDRPQVVAHRGASAQYAENTRAAFLHAIAEGADAVEVDVHLSADRQLVCAHNFTVDKTSDGSGEIAEMSLNALRALDVHSWKNPELPEGYGSSAQQLITLPELLDIVIGADRGVDIALEMKHPSAFGHELDDAVLDLLTTRGWDPKDSSIRDTSSGEAITVTLMSFSPAALEHVLVRFPQLPPRHLCALFQRGQMEALYLVDDGRVGVAGPSQAYVRHHRWKVRRWLRHGIELNVWTVDEPEDVRYVVEVGARRITTNRPGAVRRLLESAEFSGAGTL